MHYPYHDLFTEEELEHVRATPTHPQARIEHRDLVADVDEAIASLIMALWRAGIPTVMSCIGTRPDDADPIIQRWWDYCRSDDEPAMVWIEFGEQDHLLAFLSIAAGAYDADPESIYNRIGGMWASEAPHWHISVDATDLNGGDYRVDDEPPAIAIWSWSIRFPHADFPEVQERALRAPGVHRADDLRSDGRNFILDHYSSLAVDLAEVCRKA